MTSCIFTTSPTTISAGVGYTQFEQVAEPGYSETFEARRVVGIEAGNAGAVSVEVNGQDVGPLGEPGQVLSKSYTLKSEG